VAEYLPASSGPSKREVMRLGEMLGKTAEEVERISRDLRPGVLEQLGLAAVFRTTSTEFASRTGISVRLVCRPRCERLPADAELALYRILQETLRNVERHSSARHVTVSLKREGSFVQMVIRDDGIGFDPHRRLTGRRGPGGLGLLSISERASYVDGAFKIRSVPGAGTEIAVTIPLPAGRTVATG
jgi:two-component system NarL family sensor kinase